MYLCYCWSVLWAFAMTAIVSGKVVKHEMTLTWEVGAPNGQAREMVKMNGQFPGPSLIWDEDDDIEVQIHMPFNTSVHWHGMM
jgi:FtsP/CotA-like multicopper oxidase with cupredoxin domain